MIRNQTSDGDLKAPQLQCFKFDSDTRQVELDGHKRYDIKYQFLKPVESYRPKTDQIEFPVAIFYKCETT